jgi:hypothetical protein
VPFGVSMRGHAQFLRADGSGQHPQIDFLRRRDHHQIRFAPRWVMFDDERLEHLVRWYAGNTRHFLR